MPSTLETQLVVTDKHRSRCRMSLTSKVACTNAGTAVVRSVRTSIVYYDQIVPDLNEYRHIELRRSSSGPSTLSRYQEVLWQRISYHIVAPWESRPICALHRGTLHVPDYNTYSYMAVSSRDSGSEKSEGAKEPHCPLRAGGTNGLRNELRSASLIFFLPPPSCDR